MVRFCTIEVDARGLVSKTVHDVLKQLWLEGTARNNAMRNLSVAAEKRKSIKLALVQLWSKWEETIAVRWFHQVLVVHSSSWRKWFPCASRPETCCLRLDQKADADHGWICPLCWVPGWLRVPCLEASNIPLHALNGKDAQQETVTWSHEPGVPRNVSRN